MVVPKEGLYIMSKPTIKQLSTQNEDLKKELDALREHYRTKFHYLEENMNRQQMIKQMLITSEIVTEEQFELLERIVAPLDQEQTK